MDIKNVYPNIKRFAAKKRIKMREVEIAAGVSPGYFSRMKDKRVSTTALIRAKDYLGVELEDLLEEGPITTNADKFEETFGFDPRIEMPRDNFWYEPYQPGEQVR